MDTCSWMRCATWRKSCWIAVFSLLVVAPAFAQSPSAESARLDVDSMASVMQQGAEFERQGLWADALSLYQAALKNSPENSQLVQRRSLARIHYDLGRRYADSSFLQQIARTTPSQAQNAYSEVLLKVQSYYVDMPDWDRITRYGLMDLQIALHNPDFQSTHLTNQNSSRLSEVLSGLAATLEKTVVRQRSDSVWVANHTSAYLQQNLGLPVSATIYEFVSGATAALDPYSAYMSEAQYNETMSQIEGNFVGLGVELKTHSDHLEIVNVISGGPAGLGGLQTGDLIVGIDGSSVEQVGSEKSADNLRGIEGSFLKIEIKRGTQPNQSIQLQRRRVEIPSVDHVAIVDRDSGVGYIRLTNFQKTTSRDFDAALLKLQRDGMRTLIVDVRGNPGGLLTAAVEVADRFIGNGVIVSTKGRNPLEDFTHKAEAAGTWRVPLVVLVDEDSASASEIFAAAIRDHKRGLVVGHQSYGKGSVQGIFPLNIGGGGIRLTTAKFYSPQGHAISQVGVKPDIPVESVSKPAMGEPEKGIDNDAALQVGISIAIRESKLQPAFAGR